MFFGICEHGPILSLILGSNIILLKRSMMNLQIGSTKSDRKITITAHIISASTSIKFPCFFTLLWKTPDNSIMMQTQKVEATGGAAPFNQSLILETYATYGAKSGKYSSVETQFHLRLLSKHKKSEPKLVGRIGFDVSKLLNGQISAFQTMEFSLQFCSVNAVVKAMFEVAVGAEEQDKQKKEKSSGGRPVPTSPPSHQPGKKGFSPTVSYVGRDNVSPQVASVAFTSSVSPIPTSPPPYTNTDPSVDFNSSMDQIRLKSLEDDIRREASKHSQQIELLNLTIKQRDDKILALEQELMAANLQTNKYRDEARRRTDEKIKLQLAIAREKEDSLSITAELSHYKTINGNMTKTIELLEQEVDMFRSQLMEQVGSLEHQNNKLRQTSTQMAQDLQKIQNILKQTEEKLVSVINDYNVVNEKLSLAGEKGQNFQKQVQELTHMLKERQNKINLLQEQSSSREKQLLTSIDMQKTQIFTLEKDVKELRELKKQGENNISSLQNTVLTLNEQLTQKDKRISNLEDQLQNTREQQQNKLANQISTLRDELTQVKQKGQEQRSQLKLKQSELEQQLIINKGETSDKISQMLTLQQKLKNSETSVAQLQSSNQLLQSNNQFLSSKLSELEELLLSNNELKTKELSQAQQSQHNSHLKYLEMEQQSTSAMTLNRKYEQKIQILEKDLEDNIVLVTKLQEGLSHQIDNNQKLNLNIIQSSAMNEKYLGDIRNLQNQVVSINKLLQQAEQHQQKLKDTVAQLEGQIQDIYIKWEEDQNKGRQLQEQIGQANQQFNRQIDQYQNKIVEVEKEVEDLRQIVSNKEEYVKELEKKVENVEKKYSQLTSRVSATSKETAEEVIELKTGNQELLNNLQEKDKQIIQLNGVISQLKEENSGLTSQVEGLKQKEIKLNQQILHISLQNQQSADNCSKQQPIILQLNQQIESLKSTIEEHKQKEEVFKLKEQQLMESLETQTMEHQEQRNQDADRVGQLMKNVTELQKIVSSLPQGYQSNTQIPAEKMGNNEEVTELNEELFLMKSMLKGAKEEVEQLRKENKLLSNYQRQQPPSSTINLHEVTPSNYEAKTQEKNGLSPEEKVEEGPNPYILELQRVIKSKQQQNISLQEDLDRLACEIQEVYELRQQVEAYKQELELNEEQRFNLQAQNNENNMHMAQVQEENLKLNEEIAMMTERNNQIEDTLNFIENIEGTSEEDLKTQIGLLHQKIKQLEDKNAVLNEELDQKDDQHVVELIDQHIRLSKSDIQNSSANVKSTPRLIKEPGVNVTQICKELKELLSDRKQVQLKSYDEDKNGKEAGQVAKHVRIVSLELQKLKSQLFKNEKKANIGTIMRPCEQKVKNLCQIVQQTNL